jgi:CheY-like chemotaxis protein
MSPTAKIAYGTLVKESKRVLIVDDNAQVADTTTALLRLMGYEVEHAYSGEAALPLEATFNPQAIFIDLKMAEMDGCELARRLLARGCEAKLIALTAFTTAEFVEKADKAGFDLFLQKPATAEQLLEALERPRAAN